MNERPIPSDSKPEIIGYQVVCTVAEVVWDGEVMNKFPGNTFEGTVDLTTLAQTPGVDYFEVTHTVKGTIRINGLRGDFESKPHLQYKIFVDGHILSSEEISRKRGMRAWMKRQDIRRLVRTRGGAITEFGENDLIITSQPAEKTADTAEPLFGVHIRETLRTLKGQNRKPESSGREPVFEEHPLFGKHISETLRNLRGK